MKIADETGFSAGRFGSVIPRTTRGWSCASVMHPLARGRTRARPTAWSIAPGQPRGQSRARPPARRAISAPRPESFAKSVMIDTLFRMMEGGSSGNRRPSRATLAEVASLADVSISTVSKVLNGRSGVSTETRARIEALLEKRQYNRRTSRRTVAPLIDVLCYEIDSPFGSEVVVRIESISRERRIGMVLSGATEDHL